VSAIATVDDVLAALPTGGNVVLTGASRETLGRLPGRLLRAAVGVHDAALLVTTEDSGRRFARRIVGPSDGPDRSRVGIVDAPPTGRRRTDPAANTWHVSSPVDFNGTATGIDRCFDKLAADGCQTVNVLYDTLTTPFLSADSSMAARYAHYVSLQVADREGIGLFPVHTNVTSDRDVERLKHLFDALVEVRKCGGGRQVRCSSVECDWSDWRDLRSGDADAGFTGIV